jgi:excisionase family DNA binding protein
MLDQVSQAEAADLLGVSEGTVAKFRANGRLAFVKHANGGIRIHRHHVLALAKVLAAPRPTKAFRRAMSADCATWLPASFLRPIIRKALASV